MTTLILGAGIAGVLLARELASLGQPILLIDAGPAERASAVPGALLHAHPGRSLTASPEEQEAFSAAWQAVERWSAALPGAVWTGPMIRPLVGTTHAERLAATLSPDMPTLSPDALRALHPALHPTTATTYAPAAMIDLPRVLAHELEAANVSVEAHTITAIHHDGACWSVHAADGWQAAGEAVVLACGASLARFFPALGVGFSGGELGVWSADEALDCVVDGAGHIAPRPDGRWIGGSTYLRVTGWEGPWRPDADAEAELRERLATLVPAMATARCELLWRGVRASMGGERRPLAGPVPGKPGLWVFGALSSRGLFWAPWLAQRLAAHMVDPLNPTPALVHPDRHAPHRWRMG